MRQAIDEFEAIVNQQFEEFARLRRLLSAKGVPCGDPSLSG
jgi:hypothetical protein